MLGNHTLKAGVSGSFEQVNVNPNPTFNGSFLFSGSETGLDFADFLIGVASNYNQADSQAYYLRHKYAGGYAQDSWRIRPNLTLNYGVRWELMEYWSEKYNQIPTFIPGEQSKVYPRRSGRARVSGRPGSSEHAGAVEEPFFSASGHGVVAGQERRNAWERFSADPGKPASAPATGFIIP